MDKTVRAKYAGDGSYYAQYKPPGGLFWRTVKGGNIGGTWKCVYGTIQNALTAAREELRGAIEDRERRGKCYYGD